MQQQTESTIKIDQMRQQVLELFDAEDTAGLTETLRDEHPADIADLLETLEEAPRVAVFTLLEPPVAAEVLDEARTETLVDIIEAVPDGQIADLLEALPIDDAVEILSEISDEQADALIALMEAPDAAEVEQQLAYPEESAGRLMATNIVRLNAKWEVQEALVNMRRVDPDAETLAYLYVVNDAGEMVGLVPLRNLITANADRLISQIMDRSVITVRVDTDQEEVARIMAQYDFFAVPIVDYSGRLVGIVTHDDVVDVLQEEFTEDVQRFGGSAPLENSYLATSIPRMVQKRIGWLFLLFFTAQLTTTIMASFEDELNTVVALSFFIPLLIGTGGNAGSQMTATMIRAVAVGEVRFSDIWKVLGRELLTGLALGAAMGIAGLIFARVTGQAPDIALTVALALFLLVVWANLMGVALPIVADRVNMDPTVISGPVMSTLVDATGLLFYFSIARIVITQL